MTQKLGSSIMKKTMKFIGLIAMAAVLFSCEKKIIDTPVENPQETETPSDLSQLDPGKYLVSFGATIESVDTKANVDLTTGDVSFVDGDKVLVVSGSTSGEYEYKFSEDKFAPIDESNAVEMSADMKAYYPADNYSVSSNVVTFTMPEATEENPGSLAPMCAIINGSTAEFKNLGAILKLNLTAGEAITAVELVASKPIAGSSELSWNADGIPELSAELNGASNVKHYFTTAIPAGTATTLYFFLPADIETELEIHAIYGKTVEGVTYEPYKTIKRNPKLTTVRNYVYSIAKSLPGFFSAGDGFKDTPYEIANADDFKAIANLANADAEKDGNGFNTTANRTFFGSEGVHYKQVADIIFTEKIKSIGVYNSIPFKGQYDGYNHTLSGFQITGENATSTGLFEYLEGATIKNLNITGSTVTGADAVGTLAGRIDDSSKIENCSLNKDAPDASCIVQGANAVGGLVAHLSGSASVQGCSINGKIILATAPDKGSDNSNNQGGIIGYSQSNGQISGCTTGGTIIFQNESAGKTGVARGGIIGQLNNKSAVIINCTNGASLETTMNDVGGIAGLVNLGKINDCINIGKVSGAQCVGGIAGNIGSNSTTVLVSGCRNQAAITGSNSYVGGIIGRALNGAVVSTCFAAGKITGLYDVGGIVGLAQANKDNANARVYVYDCLSKTDIESTNTEGEARAGGVVGSISLSNQYVRIDNCGVTNVTITTANASQTGAGGFIGKMNSSSTTKNKCSIRNCYTLVSTVPGDSKCGGFVGDGPKYGELLYCYYVADATKVNISTNITKTNYIQTTANAETCTTFNNNNYNLTINGTTYSSSRGWTIPAGCDYPVPGSLLNKGDEYYK